ncbi:MAG: hypothetical protein WBM43_12265 [Flavobacteriaceae bacterium]
MKSQNLSWLLLNSMFILVLMNCKTEKKDQSKTTDNVIAAEQSVIKVLTKSMEFICRDSIPSGWNTFVYENQSTEPHFILLDKYPEGKSIVDMKKDVGPPFDEGMALIMEGKTEEAMEAFGQLPEWFSQVVFSGGTGMISPAKKAVTHVNLKPGYYIMECYVKMPDGEFHSSMGMTKELIVMEEQNDSEAPVPDIKISLSSKNGITYKGSLSAGKKIFEVNYIDHIVHENFVGHDVNLVQLGPKADLQELEQWMNWATPEGLMSSTLPSGITFLGGTNDAPAGSVQYFEADLKPGNYAFISEVPNSSKKGLLKSFTVL